MPRIQNLGDLDYNFENVCDAAHLHAETPVYIEHNHVLTLNLLVTLDRDRARPIKMPTGERSLWHNTKGCWVHSKSENLTPILRPEIQALFVRLFEEFDAAQVLYSWDGYRQIGILLSLAWGEPKSIDPLVYPVGTPLKVEHYDRFLHSLASRMGRWYRK